MWLLPLLAMFGLPPRRLPAADLPLAFRFLAVALVPAPRLILAAAAFAQALPLAPVAIKRERRYAPV